MGAFAMAANQVPPEVDGLVEQARAGDLPAFEQLYRRNAGRVMAICLRLCGERSVAEDLVQETFIRAWERLGLYTIGTNFGAWLAKIAVNVTLTDRRARGRRSARELAREDLEGASAPGQPLLAAAMDLERAIAGLPDAFRRVFVLHDVEGYKHREIADMLGLAEGTSKAQLHRARKLLREALSP